MNNQNRISENDRIDINNIAKELMALTPVKYREVMRDCYKLLDVKKKELRTLPNNPETRKETVVVKRQQKIDPLGLFTRTVTEEQQVYTSAFRSIRDLLKGEKYILISSEESVEDQGDIWEEWDRATVLTESGRLLFFDYSFKYVRKLYAKSGSARELDHTDRKTNMLLAAEINRYIGVAEFMKLTVTPKKQKEVNKKSSTNKDTGVAPLKKPVDVKSSTTVAVKPSKPVEASKEKCNSFVATIVAGRTNIRKVVGLRYKVLIKLDNNVSVKAMIKDAHYSRTGDHAFLEGITIVIENSSVGVTIGQTFNMYYRDRNDLMGRCKVSKIIKQ